MIMKKLPTFYLLLLFYALLSPSIIFAQLDDNIEPPPTSPIDEYAFLFVLCALITGFSILHKFNHKKTK